jgi:transposase
MAGESIGCRPGAAMQFEAKVLTESIKNTKEQIEKVDKEIEKISGSCEEYAYLQTIPGFGPYVSAVVLAAIGNPHRFENIQQLKRLAGFDLNASRSGKRSSSAVPVISKKGKGDLRYALYQAALVASSLTRQFRAYYHCILKGREREKGIRTKMRVKLASKFLVIAWTLMKKKEPFSPSYLKI